MLHAFLRADIDRDLFAERPEDAELASDEILKLEEALCECWTAAKLWHDHAATLQEGMVFTPFLTDPSRCRNCEVDVGVLVHVDEGVFLAHIWKFSDCLIICQVKSCFALRDILSS